MTSIVALASPLIALFGLLLAAFGALAARFSWISPIQGFLISVGVGLLLCGVAASICGVIGIFRTRANSHRTGAPQAWAGTILGLAMPAALFLLSPADGAPPIHDLTTDLSDPPSFVALAAIDANRERDLTYPHGPADTATVQREHYPDIATIELDADPAEAIVLVERAARELGWRLVEVDEPSGRVEAYDITSLFRFVDDVVIRVRARPDGGSLVDVRSTSRVGQSDLGANAERIRSLRDRLLD
jgi:uncharacterized protein (DUF1499 family)